MKLISFFIACFLCLGALCQDIYIVTNSDVTAMVPKDYYTGIYHKVNDYLYTNEIKQGTATLVIAYTNYVRSVQVGTFQWGLGRLIPSAPPILGSTQVSFTNYAIGTSWILVDTGPGANSGFAIGYIPSTMLTGFPNLVFFGKGNTPPEKHIDCRFIATNMARSIFEIYNIVGQLKTSATTDFYYVNDTLVATQTAYAIVTPTNILCKYNGRTSVVTNFGSLYVPPKYSRYRGFEYSNVLVVAMEHVMQLNTNTPYGTSSVWTAESVQAAQLATNLWPGSQLLVIPSNSVYYWPVYSYSVHTDTVRYATMLNLNMWDTNVPGDLLYDNVMQHYCAPISNYIAAHPEVKLIAMSFMMPVNMKERQGSVWYSSCMSAPEFLHTTGLGSLAPRPNGGSLDDTPIKIFSFGCRTFDDTTNLLRKCAYFDVMHKDAYWALDTDQGSSYYDYNTSSLTTYCGVANSERIIYNRSTPILTTNLPVIMYWSMGWYQNGAGYYNDNRLRTTNCFETFPNSVMGYWQSYSLTSIIRSDDALDQPKGYDAFSPDCNQGTNWSRSFGATYGAVREPGWSVIGETIYVNYTRGYSFVDCCYLGGGNSQWYMGPSVIICGHPFLRITDFSIEGVTP